MTQLKKRFLYILIVHFNNEVAHVVACIRIISKKLYAKANPVMSLY